MNTKLLMIIAAVYFLAWKKVADDFLLFCALFAAGLCICVFFYRMENVHVIDDKKSK